MLLMGTMKDELNAGADLPFAFYSLPVTPSLQNNAHIQYSIERKQSGQSSIMGSLANSDNGNCQICRRGFGRIPDFKIQFLWEARSQPFLPLPC